MVFYTNFSQYYILVNSLTSYMNTKTTVGILVVTAAILAAGLLTLSSVANTAYAGHAHGHGSATAASGGASGGTGGGGGGGGGGSGGSGGASGGAAAAD